jgi:broad specificity phosphatase PhoE
MIAWHAPEVTTQLILVRHGESTSNVRRIATSALEGYPLTDRGRAQAAVAARRVAQQHVDHIYCSPILRARDTARIIGLHVEAPVSVANGLEEIDVGVHEGRSEDDAATSGAVNFERWLRDGDLAHGFEGGETACQATRRVTGTLAGIVARHPGQTVVAVSHGGALALSLMHLCHNVVPLFVWANLLDNCAVVEVSVDGAGWTCTSWAGQHVPLVGLTAVDARPR